MSAREKVKDWIVNHLLETGFGSLSVAIIASLYFAESKIERWMSATDPRLSFRVFLAIFILVLALTALCAYFYFRPRLKFLPKIGVFIDEKSKLYYCPACKVNKVLAPLKESERGWHCSTTACKAFFPNPEFVSPKVHLTPQQGNSWMAR